MHRLPHVLTAAALLLVCACSAQGQVPNGVAGPAPVVPAPSPTGRPALDSPLLKVAPLPGPPAPRSTPTKAAPARGPRVPIVGTDPGGRLPPKSSEPARLVVDKIDLRMDVVKVGTDDKGNMALPASVSQVGWYEFGARPSDRRGATVLAAHVDSVADGIGPFARLRDLRQGEVAALTDRSGKTQRYRVDSVKLVEKTEVPLGELFDRDAKPRLVLITCGGAYDRGTGYRDNVVVTATPLSES